MGSWIIETNNGIIDDSIIDTIHTKIALLDYAIMNMRMQAMRSVFIDVDRRQGLSKSVNYGRRVDDKEIL